MKSDHFSYDDAARKLAGSIILYKKEPFIVRSNDNARVNLFLSPIGDEYVKGTAKEIRVPFNDKDLDIAIPLLGYCNYNNESFYLSRALGRINRQGISSDTIHSIPHYYPGSMLYSQSMINTIKGFYPSFDECLNSVDRGHAFYSRAFGRYLAINCDNSIYLNYRGRQIGSLDLKKKTIYIFAGEQASFFDKLITELGISYKVS